MKVLGFLAALTLAACGSNELPTLGSARLSDVRGDDDVAERMALWEQVARPSVQVYLNGGMYGSGTVVHQNKDRALVLTAAHVVFGPDDQVITIAGQKTSATGKVVRVSPALDLALLRCPPVFDAVVQLYRGDDKSTVGWGSRVVAFGYPLGVSEGVLTDGRITSTDDDGYLRYSCPTTHGNSGCGIFVRDGGAWKQLSVCQGVFMQRVGADVKVPYIPLGRGAKPDVLQKFVEGIADVK